MKRNALQSFHIIWILWPEPWPIALLCAIGGAVIIWKAWKLLQRGRAWLDNRRAKGTSQNRHHTTVLSSRNASGGSEVNGRKQPRSERAYDEEKKQRAVANVLKPELKQIGDRLGQIQSTLSSIDGTLAEVRVELRNMVPAARDNQSTFLLNNEATARQHPTSPKPAGSKSSRAMASIPLSYDSLCENGLRGFESAVVFAGLDIDGSSTTTKKGEVRYRFKTQDSKQSAFVIFEGKGDEGSLFPNPVISFTEAMGYVFRDLSRDNFETKKSGVGPVKVRRLTSTAWEMVVKD